MEILDGPIIKKITGRTDRKLQESWFKEAGFTYQSDTDGRIWTTDDWLNGKDKLASEKDDGFNLGAIG